MPYPAKRPMQGTGRQPRRHLAPADRPALVGTHFFHPLAPHEPLKIRRNGFCWIVMSTNEHRSVCRNSCDAASHPSVLTATRRDGSTSLTQYPDRALQLAVVIRQIGLNSALKSAAQLLVGLA